MREMALQYWSIIGKVCQEQCLSGKYQRINLVYTFESSSIKIVKRTHKTKSVINYESIIKVIIDTQSLMVKGIKSCFIKQVPCYIYRANHW